MSFLFPGFLLAFAALSVPVIIHLFNFRKFKKVFFTNVRFLKEVKLDTQSRSRLKHLLVLACRILAVSFLILAFARPFIPSATSSAVASQKIVSIYIDNSFSMESIGKNGRLIDEALRKAHEITNAYSTGDRFQLLTNDFEVRHQRLVNREEMESMIDEVKTGSSVRKISEVVQRMKDIKQNASRSLVSENVSHIICLLSDFQKTTADIEALRYDSTEKIFLVPLPSQKQSNVFIDTCFISSPYVQLNSPAELKVQIKNSSSGDVKNVPVKLTVNGIQKSLSSVDVPTNGTAVATLNFTAAETGWQQAEISITDYPVTFDDNYFLSFFISTHLNILAVNGSEPNKYLYALFGHDEYFSFTNVEENRIDYSAFGNYHLIILNELKSPSSGLAQELNRFLEKGGTAIVLPDASASVSAYNYFLSSLHAPQYSEVITADERIASLEKGSVLFKDVFESTSSDKNQIMDLPVVKKYFPIAGGNMNQEVLLRLQNRSAFLSQTEKGKGKLFLFAVPLNSDFSGLPVHALFVPLFHRLALLSSGTLPTNSIIGRDQQAEISDSALSGDRVYHLINAKGNVDVIAGERVSEGRHVISFQNQISKAGNYELKNGNKISAVIPFNYDRAESDLACLSSSELDRVISSSGMQNIKPLEPGNENLSVTLQRIIEGTHLWKWCIMLALLFLAAEILLIRFFRIRLAQKPTTN